LARLAIYGPSDAHQITRGIEVLCQSAVEGAPHGGANPAWQVDIGCLDDDRFFLLFDAYDAIERVLLFFGVLLMARQANNLVCLLLSKNAAQFEDTRREIVIDAPTRRAKRLIGAPGRRRPPPASFMVDSAALRTESAIVQFSALLVRIQDMILLGVSGGATSGCTPLRWQICLFHVGPLSEIDADRSRPVLSDILARSEVSRRKPLECRRRSPGEDLTGRWRLAMGQLLPKCTNALV